MSQTEPQMETEQTGIARWAALGLSPMAPVAAFLLDGPLLSVFLVSLVLGLLALTSPRVAHRAQPALLSLVLIGQCIVLTAAFAGHPWQIDTHMVYFAVLAIVSSMGSISALLFACGLVAVHHLSLGLMLPALVYPSSDLAGNFLRTLVHAAVVVFEASVLIWSMTFRARSDAQLRDGRADLARSAEEASLARVEAETARHRAVAAAERTRLEGQRAACAVEQIARAASQAADNAAHAREMVARTSTDAQCSGDVVTRAMQAMTAIEDSARQIRAIMDMIDEIVRRTDLLALNAAVESARAGDAGLGFAVVAGEVRKLAMRSAEAMLQVRALTAASAERVSEGVALVQETGGALARIGGAVAEIDTLVQGIASVAVEQSAGLAEVNVAIARIDSIAHEDTTQAGHLPTPPADFGDPSGSTDDTPWDRELRRAS